MIEIFFFMGPYSQSQSNMNLITTVGIFHIATESKVSLDLFVTKGRI